MMDETLTKSGRFVQLLTGCQSRLYAYICTLLGGAASAHDVLQETNVVLWEKAAEYDPDRPFMPWAYKFAYFQVLAHRKTCARSKLLFDDDLLNQAAEEFARSDGDREQQIDVLGSCIAKLAPHHQDILDRRYSHNESVCTIAADLGKTPNVIAAIMYRIRQALSRCVESSLAAEAMHETSS